MYFHSNQNYQFDYQFGQTSSALSKSLQVNPHANASQAVLALFQQSRDTRLVRIQASQEVDSSTPNEVPNFNLTPAAQLGIGAVSVLALGGAFLAIKAIHKQPVPEHDVLSHHLEFDKITAIAKQAQKADDEKFSGREFLAYMRAKIELLRSQANGLYKSSQFLKALISAKRYFDQISVVETRYLGRKQQEFYRFVNTLLEQSVFGKDFLQQMDAKLNTILPEVVNDEGRDALKVYANALVELSNYEYGLQLLAQFNRYEMSSYVLIRIINDLVVKFGQMHLTNHDILLPDIMLNFSALEQIASIIEMPKAFINPEGFSKIFHFITLEIKQQDTLRQFKRFLSILEQWRPVYQQLLYIRRLYSPKKYRLPGEFCLKIPGENIFEKYKKLIPEVLETKLFIEVTYRERNDFGQVDFF
jgi:hypothetical protein